MLKQYDTFCMYASIHQNEVYIFGKCYQSSFIRQFKKPYLNRLINYKILVIIICRILKKYIIQNIFSKSKLKCIFF